MAGPDNLSGAVDLSKIRENADKRDEQAEARKAALQELAARDGRIRKITKMGREAQILHRAFKGIRGAPNRRKRLELTAARHGMTMEQAFQAALEAEAAQRQGRPAAEPQETKAPEADAA